ncbi:MAG TPA: YceI family protein [Gaiellaceae bacterium]|nr:YceI family protein [Gaiellaceae bacterium]
MSTHTVMAGEARGIEQAGWRIDPARSSVEFEVPLALGLSSVKGRFDDYDGTLDLGRSPAVTLRIDAGSVNTENARRDKHLRSDAFFGVEAHPHVLFLSETAALDGERLSITGRLGAAGASEPLELVATLRRVGEELEIEAVVEVDQKRLGMTYTLMGMIRTPARLAVRGRLVRSAPIA